MGGPFFLKVALCLIAALVLAGCAARDQVAPSRDAGTSVSSSIISVAAAADLRPGLDEALGLWHGQRPGHRAEVVYGSSGLLATQIRNGARHDLFFSADESYARAVLEAGIAREMRSYAIGRLVLWVPNARSQALRERGLKLLLDPAIERVAIGNPQHAPYGRAAHAALEDAGLWSRIESKTVRAENIGQAATWAHSGAASAGVIALSLAQSAPLRDSGTWHEIEVPERARLHQYVALLAPTGGEAAPGARDLMEFMLGAQGQQILARHGFFPPAPTPSP